MTLDWGIVGTGNVLAEESVDVIYIATPNVGRAT